MPKTVVRLSVLFYLQCDVQELLLRHLSQADGLEVAQQVERLSHNNLSELGRLQEHPGGLVANFDDDWHHVP